MIEFKEVRKGDPLTESRLRGLSPSQRMDVIASFNSLRTQRILDEDRVFAVLDETEWPELSPVTVEIADFYDDHVKAFVLGMQPGGPITIMNSVLEAAGVDLQDPEVCYFDGYANRAAESVDEIGLTYITPRAKPNIGDVQ